ncbi:hypothetical protein [Pontibacter saemangeumensis]|uniref:hypothetical protein n=1 Tax=Pontibacter saemangeumensis TaxID=1084525 RepID=UPI0031ED1B13
MPCRYHHRVLTRRKFSVVAVGQGAVAKAVQEADQRRNQLVLTEKVEVLYEVIARHPCAIHDY